MNKKLFSGVMAAITAITMTGAMAFADASVSGNILNTDVSSITNPAYTSQSLKSIVAFLSNDHTAEVPESFNDIILVKDGAEIAASYPVTIPNDDDHKYIIIIFGGIDEVNEKKIITMPHDFEIAWDHDETNHWEVCSVYGCTDPTHVSGTLQPHVPAAGNGDCTSATSCSVCERELGAGALSHVYTDAFDGTCNTSGCTFSARPTSRVTVTFNSNGGSAPSPATITTAANGKLGSLPAAPTRNGWTFDGWYTAQTGGTKIVANSTVAYANATAYAHWTSQYGGTGTFTGGGGGGGGGSLGGNQIGNPVYIITFETNGGTAVKSYTSASNMTINFKDFTTTKENYEFAGWYSDAALTKELTSVVLSANITAYAKWVEPGEAPSQSVEEPLVGAFTDVKVSDWFGEAVNYVLENGIMNGVSETEFAPHNTTTRAMLVTMLYRLDGEPETTADNEFSDVAENSYYEKAVIWASNNGIAGGYGDGIFGAENPITREQLASILHRYASFKGYDASYEDTNILSFDDAFEISDYAYPALQWACKNGIINGDGNNLMPSGVAERCQVATMLMRFCEMIKK